MANYLLHLFLWIPPKTQLALPKWPEKNKNEMKSLKSLFLCLNPILGLFLGQIFSSYYGEIEMFT